jgi:hypothetical protein
MHVIDILPALVLCKIASFLIDDSPFRDKVDVATDAVMLQIAGWKSLSCYVFELVDPCCLDGKLNITVRRNLGLKKNQRMTTSTVKNTWGLTDVDLGQLVATKNLKYRFQDVKKLSAIKFENNYDNLQNLKHAKQIDRYKKLISIFQDNKISIQLDSKLCERYIKFGKGDPDHIAQIIKENEFYHMYTNYIIVFEKCMANYHCEFGYYDIVFITLQAKKQVLEDFIKKNSINMIPISLHKYM